MSQAVRKAAAIALVLMVFNVSVFADSVPGNTTGSHLWYSYQAQIKSAWCWAASAKNINLVEYPSSTRMQYDVVNYYCGTSSDPYPNESVPNTFVRNAARYISYFNKSYSLLQSTLSYSYIEYKVYNNHPVIALCNNASGNGHVVLIMGWDLESGTTQKLWYFDPSTDSSAAGYHCCTYASFIAGGYNGNQGLKYIESVYLP